MSGLVAPKVILFDRHATLVDTLDAMYHAVDDVLTQLEALGLAHRLIDPAESKTIEDAKLINHVRCYHRLHPKVIIDRKISRTDIFELLFSDDDEAKHIAHQAFSACYRNHFGEVHPLEEGIPAILGALRKRGLKLDVQSNRDREFLEHEIRVIEGGSWSGLFDTIVSGDDTPRRKPAPHPILRALANLNVQPALDCWYVGDSTTDTVSAKQAGVTSVFYNGAGWDHAWLAKIFPNTERHPHQPDIIVANLREFLAVIDRCL